MGRWADEQTCPLGGNPGTPGSADAGTASILDHHVTMRRTAWISTVLADAAENLFPARMQMAMSLGWHIIFSCFGVGFPAIVVFTEWRAHRRGDADLRDARPHLGQGDGRAVRGRRRVRHPAVLRDGHPVARADGALRRGVRLPVRAGGLRLLHRGDLRRDLPLRLGPHVAAGAHAQRDADDHFRRGRGVLRDRRERVDEQPDRVRLDAGRPGGRRRPGRRDVRPVDAGRSSCTCCWPRTWSPGSRSPPCTRSGCCAGGATATTAPGCSSR